MSSKFVILAYGSSIGASLAQPILDSDFILFLNSIIANLQLLLTYGKDYIDASISCFPKDYSGESLEDIFKRFAATPDIESTKHWIGKVCYYLSKALIVRDEGVIKHFEQVVKDLEKFKIGLAEKDLGDDNITLD